MKKFSTVLSLLLIPLMVVVPLQAEMPSVAVSATGESVPGSTTPKSQTAGETNALQIRLADAGNAVVEASSILKGYAVAVTDGAGLPVSDAAVAIRLPEDGPTGFFADGAHSAVAYTNASGVATFAQVNWGSALGLVAIRVTAVKGELHAGAIIEQTIVARSEAAVAPVQFQAQTPAQAQAKTQVKVAPWADAGAALPAQSANLPAPGTTPTLASPPAPGTPASTAAVHSSATPDQKDTRTVQPATSPEPVVSIVNSGGASRNGSNKKWILLAVLAAGAGVGAAVALAGGHGAVASTAPATVFSIGTPTISVGH